MHNGYKGGAKAKPWKKAKTLKFDDKNEAKAEGELSYPATTSAPRGSPPICTSAGAARSQARDHAAG